MKENFPSMNFSLSGRAEYCIFVEKNQCMRNVLELKIEEWWAVLAPDTSISIEMTSPLWHDSGTFSYTFQLPYYANRHIFNASDKPESDVNLKTFRKRFGLYLYGVGFLFGDIVCTSDEIDTDNDRVDVEIRSANATFEDAIDGKSLRDLDLGDVVIGMWDKINREYHPDPMWHNDPDHGAGMYYAWEKNMPYVGIRNEYKVRHNGSTVYPAEKYINIPIIVYGLENGDSEKKNPLYISPYRAFSSPCFFVAYLLKLSLTQHQFTIVKNDWDTIEDLRRLIILNTKFKYNEKEISQTETSGKEFSQDEQGPLPWDYKEFKTSYELTASSENLPETNLSEFINSLKNAFGLRLLIDSDNKVRICFLRNIFRNTELKKMTFVEVLSVSRKHLDFNGITIKYGTEDGEEFKYNSYKEAKAYSQYEPLLKEWTDLKGQTKEDSYTGLLPIEEDTLLRIDKETGNFYRTKVDEKTFDEAQLFEVAQFIPYEIKGIINNGSPEELSIGFTPIIPTVINNSKFTIKTERPVPTEAFFVNVEIPYDKNSEHVLELKDAADEVYTSCRHAMIEKQKNLLDFDCGFTMGIVRTSPEGSLSENYTVVTPNVDGFGNDEWVRTLCTTTVTSDSLSREGYLFDYNGTDEGIGAPMEQLVSLKLWSGKQNFDPSALVEVDSEGNTITGKDVYNNNPTGPLPNRGLVPQFLSEYLHFMKHRKPISVVGNIHVSELLNVEWDKYHDVAGYRGLLDKIKFTVSMEGMSEVTVDHFII